MNDKEKIDIRFVGEKDLNNNAEAIVDMFRENYLVSFPDGDNVDEFKFSKFESVKKFVKDGSAIFVGAYSGDKIVGFIWAYKKFFFGEERIHITAISVESSFRNRGIGRRLIEFIEEYTLNNGIEFMELVVTSSNDRAVNLYKKCGFNVTRLQLEKKSVETCR